MDLYNIVQFLNKRNVRYSNRHQDHLHQSHLLHLVGRRLFLPLLSLLQVRFSSLHGTCTEVSGWTELDVHCLLV